MAFNGVLAKTLTNISSDMIIRTLVDFDCYYKITSQRAIYRLKPITESTLSSDCFAITKAILIQAWMTSYQHGKADNIKVLMSS